MLHEISIGAETYQPWWTMMSDSPESFESFFSLTPV